MEWFLISPLSHGQQHLHFTFQCPQVITSCMTSYLCLIVILYTPTMIWVISVSRTVSKIESIEWGLWYDLSRSPKVKASMVKWKLGYEFLSMFGMDGNQWESQIFYTPTMMLLWVTPVTTDGNHSFCTHPQWGYYWWHLWLLMGITHSVHTHNEVTTGDICDYWWESLILYTPTMMLLLVTSLTTDGNHWFSTHPQWGYYWWHLWLLMGITDSLHTHNEVTTSDISDYWWESQILSLQPHKELYIPTRGSLNAD